MCHFQFLVLLRGKNHTMENITVSKFYIYLFGQHSGKLNTLVNMIVDVANVLNCNGL